MKRTMFGIGVLLAGAVCWPGATQAVTREIAELQRTPLTPRMSVIHQLSGGLLSDPYDELLSRPFNLHFTNLERNANLSPWPGQEGEQVRYVDFLIGNNGNTNVRNGSDTLQGTYISQRGGKFVWGVSGAYLGDDIQNTDLAAGANFADSESLLGLDGRFAMGYRVSNRMLLGGGVSAFKGTDTFDDASFTQGLGGSFSLQELDDTGFEADFGFRMFTGESKSWDATLMVGSGSTQLDDYSDTLDATGAIISRFVINRYDIQDVYVQLSGGHNRLFLEGEGEMQFRAGVSSSRHELSNSDLSFTDALGVITPSLTLLSESPVTDNEVFASAQTLFVRGWTQIFGAARISVAQLDGSTEVDSVGVIVNESIDDSELRLALTMGLRQPLWNERFRLVARARAEVSDSSRTTIFDAASSSTDVTQTTTEYAIGIETVLNNMAFDVAWLFGNDSGSGGTTTASRQTIDLDRIVISATFGW